MTPKRIFAVCGGAAVCGGLFLTLMFYHGKAIAPRGQPPFLLSVCVSALFLVGLLIAAVSDVKSREIPNAAPLLLLAAGALKLALAPSVPVLVSALLGVFLGGFGLLLLAVISKSVGGGDVKLAGSAGLALGWLCSYLALQVGLILFVLAGIVKCFSKADTEKSGTTERRAFPFAPAYAVGAVAVAAVSCLIRHSFNI